jgi:hypothetical protein
VPLFQKIVHINSASAEGCRAAQSSGVSSQDNALGAPPSETIISCYRRICSPGIGI